MKKTKILILALLAMCLGLSFNANASFTTDSTFFGQSITIGVTHTGNNSLYHWIGRSDEAPSIVVAPLTTTNYVEQWTNPYNGIDVYDTIQVVVKDLPNTMTIDTIISGQSITIGKVHPMSNDNCYMWGSPWANGPHHVVNPTSTTIYVETWTNPYNAVNTYDTFKVVVKPQISTLLTSTTTTTICSGDTAHIGVAIGNAVYYAWSNNAPSTATISVNPTSNTVYTRIVYDGNGVIAKDTFSIIVKPSPTVWITGPTSAICLGTSCMLSAHGANTYHWLVGTGVNGATLLVIAPSTTSNYTVIGYDTSGCTGTATFTVAIQPPPVAYTVTGDTSYCANQQGVSIGLSGSQTNAWYMLYDSTAVVTMIPGTGFTLNFGYHPNGSYTIKGSINTYNNVGCESLMNGTIHVTVNPLPGTANFSIPITQPCEGQSVTYGPAVSTNATSYLWSVPNGATIINGQWTSTATINWGNSSGGQITVFGHNACGNSLQPMVFTVTVKPQPTLTISANPGTICSGGSSLLSAASNVAVSYYWGPGDTTSIKVVSPTGSTAYGVTVTAANGCTNSGAILVTVNPKPTALLSLSPIKACKNENIIQLGGGSPFGGHYWGQNVPIWGDSLYVSLLNPGGYIINYSVTNQYSCSDTASGLFSVYPNPTISWSGLGQIYTNTPSFQLNIAQPTGGVYSNAGVLGNQVSGYWFWPNLAGAGAQILTYTYTHPVSGCVGSDNYYFTILSGGVGINEYDGSIHVSGATKVIIVNAAGQTVYQGNADEISTTHLVRGIYYVIAANANGYVFKHKMVKK